MVVLPDWLTEVLPDPVEPAVLSIRGEELIVSLPGGSTRVFNDLAAADNFIHQRGLDLHVTPEVFKKFGDNDTMIFYPVEDKTGYSRLIHSFTDENRYQNLVRSFENSLRNSENFQKEQSFYNAWNFIDTHPAFWVASPSRGNSAPNTWYWETNNMQNVSQHVYKDDNDVVSIELEFGGHVAPEYKEHYHDWRLTARRASFEDAVIALASNVTVVFDDNGMERPDADKFFRKPKWIINLEERLRESEIEQ